MKGYPLQVDGMTLHFRPAEQRQFIDDLMAEIKKLRRSPLDVALAKLDRVPAHLQPDLLERALKLEPSVEDYVSDKEINEFLHTRQGSSFALWTMCRENHPDLTREKLDELFAKLSGDEFDRTILVRDVWQTVHKTTVGLSDDEKTAKIKEAAEMVDKWTNEQLRDWLLEVNGEPTGEVATTV